MHGDSCPFNLDNEEVRLKYPEKLVDPPLEVIYLRPSMGVSIFGHGWYGFTCLRQDTLSITQGRRCRILYHGCVWSGPVVATFVIVEIRHNEQYRVMKILRGLVLLLGCGRADCHICRFGKCLEGGSHNIQ